MISVTVKAKKLTTELAMIFVVSSTAKSSTSYDFQNGPDCILVVLPIEKYILSTKICGRFENSTLFILHQQYRSDGQWRLDRLGKLEYM